VANKVIATLTALIGADTSGFESGLGKVQSGLGSVLSALGPVAAGIAATFGAAAVISSASAFDSTLRNIQAVTKDTTAETAALGQELLGIGANSVAGPQAVAEAYYDIAGGVADASVRMDTLNAAIALSEAGQANLTASTQGLISVMNSYGLSADQAMMAADVFTQTVGMGVGSMDQFVAAMSPIAGLAASNGIEFDRLGSMMAWMTTKGVGASEAATQIKAAMVAIQKPNEAMKKGLQAIGAESAEAALKQWGLEGTLGRLKQAFGGNTTAMAEALGSTEALNAATLINASGYEEFLTTFQDTMSGVTDAARGVQLQAFSAQWSMFQNTLSAIATDIGLAVLPALNSLVSGARGMIQDVQTLGLGGALQKWFNAGVDWLKNDAPVLFQNALNAAIQLGTDVASWLQTNGPKLLTGLSSWFMSGVAWLTGTAPTVFGNVLSTAFNLGTDILTWLNTNGPNLLNGIRDWAMNGLTWLRTEAPALVQSALANLFGGAAIEDTAFNDALGKSAGGGGMLASLGDLATALQSWITTGVGWLATNGPALFGEALKTAFTLAGDLGQWLMDNGPDLAFGIGSWIRTTLNNLVTQGAAMVGNFFKSIFGVGQVTAEQMSDTFGAMGAMGIDQDQTVGVLDVIGNAIRTILGGALSTIGGLVEGLFGLDKGSLTAGVKKAFAPGGPFDQGVNAAKGFLQSLINKGIELGQRLVASLLTPFKTLLQAISIVAYYAGNLDLAKSAADAVGTIDRWSGSGQGQQNTGGGASFNANGTGNFGGGMTWVGERGPELLSVGSGARIIRSNQAVGGGGTAVINQHIYGVTDEQALGEAFIRFLRSRNIQIEGLA